MPAPHCRNLDGIADRIGASGRILAGRWTSQGGSHMGGRDRAGVAVAGYIVFFSTRLNMLPWPVVVGMVAHALRRATPGLLDFPRHDRRPRRSVDGATELSRLDSRLPPLLRVIAAMVDLIGFSALGSDFTAHSTGDLVLAAVAAARDGPLAPGVDAGNSGFHAGLAIIGSSPRCRAAANLAGTPVAVGLVLPLAAVSRSASSPKPSTARRARQLGIGAMVTVSAVLLVPAPSRGNSGPFRRRDDGQIPMRAAARM
jgi:hypothetical protein